MIINQHGRVFIRIPRVEELFPTPMPNIFSIENGILHYVVQDGEEEVEPKGQIPEDYDVEADYLRRRRIYHHSMPHTKT